MDDAKKINLKLRQRVRDRSGNPFFVRPGKKRLKRIARPAGAGHALIIIVHFFSLCFDATELFLKPGIFLFVTDGSVTESMMVEFCLIILTVVYVYCINKFLIKNAIFASFKIIIQLKTMTAV